MLLMLFCSFALMAQKNNQLIVNVNKGGGQNFLLERKDKGFYNIMQFNLLMGSKQAYRNVPTGDGAYLKSEMSIMRPDLYYYQRYENKLTAIPSFTITNGYMFNEHWAAGVGIGYEVFDHNLFPLFAEIRYTLWDDRISPFVVMKGGYSLASFKAKQYQDLYLDWAPYYVNDAKLRNYGGLMLHPEIGVKIPLSYNSDMLVTAAYRYQKIRSVLNKTYSVQLYDEWEHKEDLNRLSIGVAIMFR